MGEINDIVKEINKFRDARNWRQFHNEKDLSLSITLEAAELLELFQWKTSEEVVETNRERLAEEIADVLIYSYMLADNLNFDINDIIREKLVKNAEKYPIAKVKITKLSIMNCLRNLFLNTLIFSNKITNPINSPYYLHIFVWNGGDF
ncbi:nucleotide pyrophosphohydrolase [Staphylococcus epidermidis]|nr:nucleotide pyrophosphohydrolase [Staphylococcus epidermidis]